MAPSLIVLKTGMMYGKKALNEEIASMKRSAGSRGTRKYLKELKRRQKHVQAKQAPEQPRSKPLTLRPDPLLAFAHTLGLDMVLRLPSEEEAHGI